MSWRDPPRPPDDARYFIPFWAEQPEGYDPWLVPMAQPAMQRTAPPIGMLNNGKLPLSRDPTHLSHVTGPGTTELGAPRLRNPHRPAWLPDGRLGTTFRIGHSPIGRRPELYHPEIENPEDWPPPDGASGDVG